MKFGQKLDQEIFPPWRLSYIQYDMLKTELKMRQLDHEWTEQDEYDFVQLLKNEYNKAYDFITAKLGEVEARISYCERTVKSFMANPRWASEQSWLFMNEALTEVLFDVNDLSKFSRINFMAVQKILKKHDKYTGRTLQRELLPEFRKRPLDNQRFDVAIVFISALHDICARRGKPRTGNAAAGGDQNAFERATAKYWIHPDNITEVKSIIMLHLPVLIFNVNKEYEETDSAVSSVYFDNEDFDLYTGRLQRDEGAEAIRFRWYGTMDSKDIFIERKTHHAPWLNGVSIKDRFKLNVDDVPDFISGKLTADEYANRLRASGMDEEQVKQNHFIAAGIQESLKEKRLAPMCRVFYNRTAFQLPGDQRVRVSLDTNLAFVREDSLDGVVRRKPGEWRRSDMGINHPFSNINPEDVCLFPYAILETKIQTHLGQEPPEWLEKLIKSHLVHEVPRFSKYLHGACYLYSDRIPLLPWWLSEMETDIRKPREANFGLSRSKSFKPLIDGQYQRAMAFEERRVDVVADAVHRSASAASRARDRRASAASEKASKSPKQQLLPVTENRLSTATHNTLVDESGGAGVVGSTLLRDTNNTFDQNLQQQQQQQVNEKNNKLMPPPPVPASSHLYAGGFSNKSKDTFASTYSDARSAYTDNPGATLVQSGDEPRNYGTPPARQNEPLSEKVDLGEAVDVNKGDIVVDFENNELRQRSANSDERQQQQQQQQRPLKLWEKLLFGGGTTGPRMVKDPFNKDKDVKVPLKKIKIEPKVFFANERTFISWLQFCALLLTVALNLLNFGDNVSRIAGGIFIGISAVVAIYALYRFEKRAWYVPI